MNTHQTIITGKKRNLKNNIQDILKKDLVPLEYFNHSKTYDLLEKFTVFIIDLFLNNLTLDNESLAHKYKTYIEEYGIQEEKDLMIVVSGVINVITKICEVEFKFCKESSLSCSEEKSLTFKRCLILTIPPEFDLSKDNTKVDKIRGIIGNKE